ncbi:hypothetical protein CJ255_07850 [Candidatus Viridilinea mediisalina]|uniref:Uncharacterized protein n=1 Tax=Candidatus Viridilinea mediisalina TaxID=2024553 RepID=A0A2A6RKV8_9CHLR|nr:hypothetical protein CJ255_07850 [Candidatus Viridilinea mediisalina]
MARWRGGAVARWRGGAVARWLSLSKPRAAAPLRWLRQAQPAEGRGALTLFLTGHWPAGH